MTVAQAPGQLTFAQGFVVGQLVLLVALVFLFRYFFVADVPASLAQQRADLLARTRSLQSSLDARSKRKDVSRVPYEQAFEARMADILQRTQYDLAAHRPESLDWLNLIVAQAMFGYRESVLYASRGVPDRDTDLPLPSLETSEKAAAKRFVERLLNGAAAGRTMNVLDTITVTDIDFGCAYPAFTNARFRPSERAHGLRLEVDFNYVDTISLGLDTKLLLNFPQFRFGSLALAMCFRIERLAGTIGIEITPREGESAAQEIRVSLAPDFVLEAHIASVMGSKKKLQDVPKVEELLLTRTRAAIQQRLVWPNYWSIPLPVLEREAH